MLDVLEASPEGFAIVYAVWLLDSEIRNGGFHQYFWNHEQVYVALTRRSLAKLDAQAHLALFEEVTKRAAPSNGRLSYGGVRATLEAFPKSAQGSPLNAFDNRWYDLPEVEPLLVAFIRQNPLSVWEED